MNSDPMNTRENAPSPEAAPSPSCEQASPPAPEAEATAFPPAPEANRENAAPAYPPEASPEAPSLASSQYPPAQPMPPYYGQSPYPYYSQPYNQGYPPPAPPAPAPKKKLLWLKILCLVLGVLAVAALGVFGGYQLKASNLPQVNQSPSTNTPTPLPAPVIPPEDKDPVFIPDSDEVESMNTTEIYANNVNSIVGITMEGKVQNVFGATSAYASSGTGFIISANGYILTNCHVILGQTTVSNPKITVTLYNEQTYSATIMGYDESNDVALIKIEAENLDPVSWGDSDKLVAGESVAIIGHPLGELTYSISKGIVAAVNRTISVSNKKLEMFQIDAAVNSGNSGGPAFNDKGQVVGIVTSKYASSSIEGLGFCIPINTAMKIANDLINYGFVRGQAGVGLSAENVYSGNGFYQQNFGIKVTTITQGSCSEKVGIKVGDIIIGLGGYRVTTLEEFALILSNYNAGDTATISLYRDNKQVDIEITFDEYVPDTIIQTPSEG